MSKGSFLGAILCLTVTLLSAAELKPWFSKDKQPIFQPWFTYDYYHKLDTAEGDLPINAKNKFFGVNLSIATDCTYSAESELILSDTTEHSLSYDNLRFTFRKLWMNDIVGDPFSLVTGATISAPASRSLKDFNTVYHGRVEVEGHAALGRECSRGKYWTSRWWGALALGKADQGCPWLRGRGSWEKNYCDQHQVRLFLEGSAGTGHKRLSLLSPFNGYGKIKYRTVEAGAGYSYLIDGYGRTVCADYCHRLYSRDAPLHNHTLTVSIMLPFSI